MFFYFSASMLMHIAVLIRKNSNFCVTCRCPICEIFALIGFCSNIQIDTTSVPGAIPVNQNIEISGYVCAHSRATKLCPVIHSVGVSESSDLSGEWTDKCV